MLCVTDAGKVFQCSNCLRKAFTPLLLNPILLIKALSFGNLNKRGFSLPACGSGVTVPTSAKPKFRSAISFRYIPFLSKPAARPNGFLKCKLHSFFSVETAFCKEAEMK
jgi:hypothetical protein